MGKEDIEREKSIWGKLDFGKWGFWEKEIFRKGDFWEKEVLEKGMLGKEILRTGDLGK